MSMIVSRLIAKRIAVFAAVGVMLSLIGVTPTLTRAFADEVTVIGTSKIYGDDVVSARDQAISNALVTAVDRVTGNMLPQNEWVAQFETANSLIFPRAKQFVQTYKVLTESRSGSYYRVMVQAAVDAQNLKTQFVSAGLLKTRTYSPRVLIFVAEQSVTDDQPHFWWGQNGPGIYTPSVEAFARVIASSGFEVIEPVSWFDPNSLEAIRQTAEIDDRTAVLLGHQAQAQVVVVGKAIASKASNTLNRNVQTYSAEMNVRALRVESGEQLAGTRQTAVTVSTDDSSGSRKVLTSVGRSTGEKLAAMIAAAWEVQQTQTASLEVIVEGSRNLGDFVVFRRALNELEGVESVQIQELTADLATMRVTYRHSAKELGEALVMKTFGNFGIQIYEVTENRLRLALTPR